MFYVGYPWHFKSNEDIMTKIEWPGFQIITETSLMGVALLLPTFLPSWKWPFLAIFFNTEARDRTDKTPTFYFEGFMVYQLSDAKNDFYNPFYLWKYPLESIFQKFCSEI